MSRLIDTDVLIEELYKNTKIGHYGEFTDGSEVAYTYNEIVNCIDSVPLAFDVEKVVAELEEAKKKNFEAYKEATDTFEILCYGNITNAYGDAIDIVKRGGIE